MKVTIKYRLFLAMLAATATVVVSMFLIMQWSFSRGFLSYVNRMDKERLDRLAEVLVDNYQKEGGWDSLRKDAATWPRLLTASLRQEGGGYEGPERPPAEGSAVKPPPPNRQYRGYRFETRVQLLDASRTRIAGAAPREGKVEYRALLSGGKTVGYLGILPKKHVTDTRQLRFMKQQRLAMGLVAVVMLLVTAAISLPLANNMVRPIRNLALSMHRLASGRFDTRVQIHSGDELGQLGNDFNALALALEKNEEARRQWVADISHELRTPLSVLRGEIEAIQDGVRQAGPDTIRSLHVEVMHLSRLVDDLYQLSLSDVGALTYRKANLNLAQVLEHAIESFRPEFEGKKIALEASIPRVGRYPVFADEQRLLQLFGNLLDNALKYTDQGGELLVQLTRRGGSAFVDFQDSPPGVGPAELEKLFDRLYRVENSRNRALGGAGLGLAICKKIVEAHEGTITAQAAPQGGVWIRVELPVTGGRA